MNNRERLIQAVRGGNPDGPAIYDLRPFGGRGLLITGKRLSDKAVRERAEETSRKWREHLLEMVLRGHLSLLENPQQVSSDDWKAIRSGVPEDVRERFDERFKAVNPEKRGPVYQIER